MTDQILKLGMKDMVRSSKIALTLVIIFEAYLASSWFFYTSDKLSIGSLGYEISYIALLLISMLTLIFLLYNAKDFDRNYRRLNVVQYIYVISIMVWATTFTYIGSEYRGNFDYLLFVTIVTLVPIFTVLQPLYWLLLQLACSAVMYYLASHHPHFTSFYINFTIFTIISSAAGWSFNKIRRSSYERLIELEKEKNRAYNLAHKDTLTGLDNRQSSQEVFDKLTREGKLPNDLIAMVMDINSLKKTNDELGHDAGDELIIGGANCMKQAFSPYGTVFRVGGDEFVAILRCNEEQLGKAIESFRAMTSSWQGRAGNTLSVAVGSAFAKEHPSINLEALFTIADDQMYADKRRHYQEQTEKSEA